MFNLDHALYVYVFGISHTHATSLSSLILI